MTSDYIGTGEKLMKLVDDTLSLHSKTTTVNETMELLDCSHKTAIRLFKRLDLMAYELNTFAIGVNITRGRFGESTLTIKYK